MQVYREKLIMIYQEMIRFHEELLTRIINVGMTGEMQEINQAFQKDDSFQFEKEMFRGTNDQNLNLLLDLHDSLEQKMDTYVNINAITEEELDDVQCDYCESESFLYDQDLIPIYKAGQMVDFEEFGQQIIGVISNVPYTFEERKSKGMRIEYLDATDQVYNLEYIDENGLLRHAHIAQEYLTVYEKEIPEELIFLNVLSKHFSGTIKIEDDLLVEIMEGKYFLLNKSQKNLEDLPLNLKNLLKP